MRPEGAGAYSLKAITLQRVGRSLGLLRLRLRVRLRLRARLRLRDSNADQNGNNGGDGAAHHGLAAPPVAVCGA